MNISRWFFLCLVMMVAFPASAWVPQPQVIYYGQAVDAYGWPIQSGAVVVLKVDGVEIDRHEINGSVSPGVNFSLTVLISDTSAAQPYVGNAVEVGSPVTITLLRNGVEQPLFGVDTVPPVPEAGSLVYVGLNSGTDSDGDGIPDEWEWDLIWNSGEQLQTLADVTKTGDFDLDGHSNWEEYLTGTVPYWDFDYLRILSFLPALDDSSDVELGFMSVPGKAYQIMGTTDLTGGAWVPVQRLNPATRATSILPFAGFGGTQSVLLNRENQEETFFRIELR